MMWMLAGIITIVGGILAASGFIVAKKPNAKELIDKLVPYQGWVGVVMFGWGIWELIGCIIGLGLLARAPLIWIFALVEAIVDLGVGFLLGFALISKWTLSKDAAALAKGQELRAKLVKFQVPLGFVAILLGIFYIVLRILIRVG